MSDVDTNEVMTNELETTESPAPGWAEENGVYAGGTIDEETFSDPILDEMLADTPAKEEEAPTTEPTTDEAEDETTAEETPTTEPETTEAPVNTKLRFKAKVDHNDIDVELDEADLPTMYQKAQATERAQAKLGKYSKTVDTAGKLAAAMGYGGADEMLQAAADNYRQNLMNELLESGTPQAIAEDYVNRKMGEVMAVLGGQTADAQSPDPEPAPAQTQTGGRDYMKEAGDLIAVRPELRGKNLPEEVVRDAVENGKSLLTAYMNYESKQKTAELDKLRKENKIYKQNAEAASRAPVAGTSGGGATDTKPSDPFLIGLTEDYY